MRRRDQLSYAIQIDAYARRAASAPLMRAITILLVRKGSFAWRTLTSIQGELRCVTTIDGKKTEKTFTPSDQFAPELIYFSDCTIHGRVPEPPGNERLADVIVINAIYESVEIGRPVRVEAVPKQQRPDETTKTKRPPVKQPDLVAAGAPH